MTGPDSDSDPNTTQESADGTDSDANSGTDTDDTERVSTDDADIGTVAPKERGQHGTDVSDSAEDPDPIDSAELEALVDAVQLKDRPRTGWQLRGVSNPESVAAHSWGVAYLCLVFGDRMQAEFANDGRELDPNRAVRLAIVHDLAEAETGDIPTRADSTVDTPDPAETDAAERQAIAELTGPLPARLRRDWNEYESRQSPESIFAKEMDLIELCLQALAYESAERYDPAAGDPDAFREYDALNEFFATAEPRLQTELGHALFNEIRDRYKAARDSDGS